MARSVWPPSAWFSRWISIAGEDHDRRRETGVLKFALGRSRTTVAAAWPSARFVEGAGRSAAQLAILLFARLRVLTGSSLNRGLLVPQNFRVQLDSQTWTVGNRQLTVLRQKTLSEQAVVFVQVMLAHGFKHI